MDYKFILLRRHARWFRDVCETGLNPDDEKRRQIAQRIRAQRLAKSLGLKPMGWNHD